MRWASSSMTQHRGGDSKCDMTAHAAQAMQSRPKAGSLDCRPCSEELLALLVPPARQAAAGRLIGAPPTLVVSLLR
jgi:hypothetical protein